MYITSETSASLLLGITNSVDLFLTAHTAIEKGDDSKVFIDFPDSYDLRFSGEGVLSDVKYDATSDLNSYSNARVETYGIFDTSSLASYLDMNIIITKIENPLLTGLAKYISIAFYNARS
jgi:hypothetical protein